MTSEIVPPSGTVTFLFTDVEGSTRLWELHSDEMQMALERHDEIMRSAIEGHGGYVFSTAGDAFAAAFSRAGEAVDAAAAAQAVLGGESWPEPVEIRVRMGLHVGEAQERGGDYFGPALNRCARLMGAAHGGQVVMSEGVVGLVGERPLTDLGLHRLKDLAVSERVWQLGSTVFPALGSIDEQMSNLPVQLTSFVGRVDSLAALSAAIGEHRLVSVVGPGGIGKTRLALQAAAELVGVSHDGVWFVDLVPLADGTDVGAAIGETVGLRRRPQETWAETVTDALSVRDVVLVLDNCEHVAQSSAALVGELLRRSPTVRVIATSRLALGVPGEHVFALAGLGEGSVLFRDRARLVDPTFEIDEATIQLCDRLDNMPLAIELAAARVLTMRPADMIERIDERFRMLRSSVAGASPRHAALESTLDWSVGQLEPRAASLFTALAVFAGDFDLHAAQAVAGPEADEFDVLDDLEALVALSLVMPVEQDGRSRFVLLETMKAYGRKQLDAEGRHDGVQRLHAEYLRSLTDGLLVEVSGPNPNLYLDAVEAEHDEIRAGLDWALQTDLALAAELATNVAPFWFWRCHFSTGANYLRAIADVDNPRTVIARTYQFMCLHVLTDVETLLPLLNSHLDQCPEDPLLAIRAQIHSHARRVDAAQADSDRFEALAHPLAGEWVGLTIGALLAITVRGSEAATRLLERLEPLYAGRSPLVDAGLAYGRTLIALAQGHPDTVRHAQSAGAAFAEFGQQHLAAQMRYYAAVQLRRDGEDSWFEEFELGVRSLLNLGNKRLPIYSLYHLALDAHSNARLEEAATLFNLFDRLQIEHLTVPEATQQRIKIKRHTVQLRESLEPETYNTAVALGQEMNLDQAVEWALAHRPRH